ncbi:MAG TPA: AraC family transcriptional regulator ligand-binding domain-containing protein [Pseudomonadales bacterium]|nr:AraC family transcriptional regulator ligand-binding domain-containing protein [Pseudomonadales bacterium]
MRIQETTFKRSKPVLTRDYPLLLQKVAQQFGADSKQLTEKTFETLDRNDRVVPVDFMNMIMRAIELTGERNLGLYFGRQWDVATMGVFGQAACNSENVGDALEQLVKYYGFSGLSMRVDMHRSGADYLVNLELLYGEEMPGDVGRFVTEAVLSSTMMIISMLTKGGKLFKALGLPFPDDGYGKVYQEFFGCPVYFDKTCTEMLIDHNVYEVNLGNNNKTLSHFNKDYTDHLLIDVVRKMRSLPGCIRQLLQNTHGQFPTLEDMANCLHLSPRTLCRRLSEHNTSYQALLNEVRKERAVEYLTSRQWSVEKVANQLGFSDASNFRRAFKQWTGMTPGAVRDSGLRPDL